MKKFEVTLQVGGEKRKREWEKRKEAEHGGFPLLAHARRLLRSTEGFPYRLVPGGCTEVQKGRKSKIKRGKRGEKRKGEANKRRKGEKITFPL